VINAPSCPIRRAPTDPTSSGVPARPTADTSIILRYPAPRGPANSSSQRLDNDSGAIVLILRRVCPTVAVLGINSERVPPWRFGRRGVGSVTLVPCWSIGRASNSSAGVVASALFCSLGVPRR